MIRTLSVRPFVGGLLALSMLSLSACGTAGAEQKAMIEAAMAVAPEEATRVKVAVVQPSRAHLVLELPGEIAGNEDAVLAAGEGGLVERILVKEGDEVRKGDRLVELDRDVLVAQLAQAEAQHAQAEAELARLGKLGDLASEQRLLDARTQVATAAANEKMLSVRVSRATVRAPFSGVVGALAVQVGEYVQPGSPVLRLVQLQPVKVDLPVSDRDVVVLKKGMPARVRTGASPRIVEGTVAHVSPVADVNTRSFLVEVTVANKDNRLLPGMIARVEVDRDLGEDRLVIPQDWLVTRLDQYGVFVVEDGLARWRVVTLDEIVGDRVVVGDGLEAGDKVILTGQHGLVDGDAVRVAREGVCCDNGRPVFDQTTAANR